MALTWEGQVSFLGFICWNAVPLQPLPPPTTNIKGYLFTYIQGSAEKFLGWLIWLNDQTLEFGGQNKKGLQKILIRMKKDYQLSSTSIYFFIVQSVINCNNKIIIFFCWLHFKVLIMMYNWLLIIGNVLNIVI